MEVTITLRVLNSDVRLSIAVVRPASFNAYAVTKIGKLVYMVLVRIVHSVHNSFNLFTQRLLVVDLAIYAMEHWNTCGERTITYKMQPTNMALALKAMVK